MSRINWPVLMRASMRRGGLAPEVFWALTPAELMLLLGAEPGQGAMTRDGLARLIAAFPDDEDGGGDE